MRFSKSAGSLIAAVAFMFPWIASADPEREAPIYARMWIDQKLKKELGC